MIVPAAMNIESAVDMLPKVPEWVRFDQIKELNCAMGAAPPPSLDFQKGYELGIQTARAILMGSAALILKGVNPDDVL